MLATDEAALIDSSISVVARLSCSSAFTDCPERLKTKQYFLNKTKKTLVQDHKKSPKKKNTWDIGLRN